MVNYSNVILISLLKLNISKILNNIQQDRMMLKTKATLLYGVSNIMSQKTFFLYGMRPSFINILVYS